MKILVTGASGFVGRYVVRTARAAGHHVLATGRGAKAVLEEQSPIWKQASIADPNAIVRHARGCDAVVHAAGLHSEHHDANELMWVNSAGTENVLNAAKHAGVKRVVLFSCADVTLTREDRAGWNEDRQPIAPHFDAFVRSKQLAEDLALAMSGPEIEIACLRPARIWGAEDHTTLPRLIREASDSKLALPGGGFNLHSAVHVENVAHAAVLAASAPAAHGHAYYLTDAEFLEAREFYGALCKAAGVAAPKSSLSTEYAYWVARARSAVGVNGLTPAEVLRRGQSSQFDIQAAARDFDYKPVVSFEDGVRTLTEWVAKVGGAGEVVKLSPRATPAASGAPGAGGN